MKYSYMITLLIVSILSSFPAHAGSDDDVECGPASMELEIVQEKTNSRDIELGATTDTAITCVTKQSEEKKEKTCWSRKRVTGACFAFLLACTGGTLPYDVMALYDHRAYVEETTPVTVFGAADTPPYERGCVYLVYPGDGYRNGVFDAHQDVPPTPSYCLTGECPESAGTCVVRKCGDPVTIDKYVEKCKLTHSLWVGSITLKSLISLSVLTASGIWLADYAMDRCLN